MSTDARTDGISFGIPAAQGQDVLILWLLVFGENEERWIGQAGVIGRRV
jgi:hypothetical protein